MRMFLIADTNGFLKTLVIILLVYFALRFSIRLLAPLFISYIAKKAGQKIESVFKGFQEQAQNAHNSQNKTQQVPKKKKEVVGEYIDYEEIE